MKKRKTSGWAFVVAFNFVAIAAILGAAELGARWIAGSNATDQDDQLPMCRADAFTIWRYRPDLRLTYRSPEFEMQVRTNEAGLRQGPIAPAAEDVATVLFIGDSFTFGWGVAEAERYSEVLARLVAEKRPGTRLRIVNAGHWMYASDQQLVLMNELIERYRPAVVVQGIYWMHIRTLFNHRLVRTPDGTLQAVEDSKIKVSDRGVLKLRSDWLERPPLNSQLVAVVARAFLNRDVIERASEWVDYFRPGKTPDDALWALTDDIAGETIRTLQASGISYLPFLVPTIVEVTGSNWAAVGWKRPMPPTDIDISLPARRMATIFAKHGTQIIEMAAPLRDRAGTGLYFPEDGHWTAKGHAAVAEILTPYLDHMLGQQRR
ncbi:hypothetical protein [Reyranella sp.]|uniref:SGNH/GDSL hydrolase family protein n=1 Tax=Reyranella sp. TaxID=1929291 RepID=UPI00272F07AE|nr:hypothetical protein [Reyranella sp.]MDP2374048.1 hypothetical protein [Reyranella sp.]